MTVIGTPLRHGETMEVYSQTKPLILFRENRKTDTAIKNTNISGDNRLTQSSKPHHRRLVFLNNKTGGSSLIYNVECEKDSIIAVTIILRCGFIHCRTDKCYHQHTVTTDHQVLVMAN